jgi:hypothetical protein
MSNMMSSSYVPSTMLVSASGNGLTLGIPDASQAVDDSNAKSFKRSRSGIEYSCSRDDDGSRPAISFCLRVPFVEMGLMTGLQAAIPADYDGRSVMKSVQLAQHARSWG